MLVRIVQKDCLCKNGRPYVCFNTDDYNNPTEIPTSISMFHFYKYIRRLLTSNLCTAHTTLPVVQVYNLKVHSHSMLEF